MIDGLAIADLHVHTPLSDCAEQPPDYSLEFLLGRARALGVDVLGFADHYRQEEPPQPGAPPRAAKLRAELAAMELPDSPRVLVGAEAPAETGVAELAGLDFVVVECNHKDAALAAASPREYAEHILARTRRGLEAGWADVLAHPLLALGRRDALEVWAAYTRREIEEVLELARDRGAAIEITRKALGHRHWCAIEETQAFYRTGKRVGVKFAFGTDSHERWHPDCIVPMLALARTAGLGLEDFLHGVPARAGAVGK